jgi:hypothetical protein
VSLPGGPAKKSWRAKFTRRDKSFAVAGDPRQQFAGLFQREMSLDSVSIFGNPGDIWQARVEIRHPRLPSGDSDAQFRKPSN